MEKVHNEELNNLYFIPNIVKKDDIYKTCSICGSYQVCIQNFFMLFDLYVMYIGPVQTKN
jgi:hypothetical protein